MPIIWLASIMMVGATANFEPRTQEPKVSLWKDLATMEKRDTI
jgi:hypothetical protein